ncbi:MAG: OmpH family outer membrane protein [Pelagibacterales bacterium]|nr:OmpH family outer membrane protein [Pelagibacterales bacterium]
MKKFNFILLTLLFFSSSCLFADQYPNTSIGIIDINKVLTESKAAIDATKQIDKIQKNSEEESKSEDDLIIKERERLIEQQSVMAPEAFEVKVADFEKKVQNYQIERQEKLRKLDQMVQMARAKILDEVKPIINEYAKEVGITVILEKNAVVMSADEMDMTEEVIKILNKNLPKIKVELED